MNFLVKQMVLQEKEFTERVCLIYHINANTNFRRSGAEKRIYLIDTTKCRSNAKTAELFDGIAC